MASNLQCDIAILGGGLSGGLIALALHEKRPDLKTLIVETESALGGNHIWSFFASDVDEDGMALLEPMVSHRWDDYEVRFPSHSRQLGVAYHSIRSEQFDAVLRDRLPESALLTGVNVIGAGPEAVMLESGHRIEAGGVIDCRGAGDLSQLALGWQKFAGVELELEGPHGLERPIVMDATVEQIDGYRFVYVLPLGEKCVFIEETYYSDLPAMDASVIEDRCRAYAEAQGWKVARTVHSEKGVLPVAMTGGDFESYWRSGGKTAKAGVRAGLFQPTTGYSLPDAVRTALMVAGMDDLSGDALHDALHDHARKRWRAGRYFRMLDAMMFRGAGTKDRYKILERFYRLDSGLIERFYAGRSTWADKLRIVSGKPPIPVGRGIKALWESRQI